MPCRRRILPERRGRESEVPRAWDDPQGPAGPPRLIAVRCRPPEPPFPTRPGNRPGTLLPPGRPVRQKGGCRRNPAQAAAQSEPGLPTAAGSGPRAAQRVADRHGRCPFPRFRRSAARRQLRSALFAPPARARMGQNSMKGGRNRNRTVPRRPPLARGSQNRPGALGPSGRPARQQAGYRWNRARAAREARPADPTVAGSGPRGPQRVAGCQRRCYSPGSRRSVARKWRRFAAFVPPARTGMRQDPRRGGIDRTAVARQPPAFPGGFGDPGRMLRPLGRPALMKGLCLRNPAKGVRGGGPVHHRSA
jgi:hypothetical protein